VLAYPCSLPDAEAQYEAKLLLVGDGEAGSSCCCMAEGGVIGGTAGW
jgi:hypothetical protein